MKYLGNIETGEVMSAANAIIRYDGQKMALVRNGTLKQITNTRRGDEQAILAYKENNGKFTFIALNKTQWRLIPLFKAEGWKMKKAYDSKKILD